MIRIIVITLISFCFSCSENAELATSKQVNENKKYEDLKMVRGRMYSEIKLYDRNTSVTPKERIVKLERATNDPVSSAMHELVNSGLRYSGKNIKVDKIERDGDQWQIYFSSNKNPPRNLGKQGNYMVLKTLKYYIDHYDVYLDEEILFTSKQKTASKSEVDSLVRAEHLQADRELENTAKLDIN